MRRVSIMLSTIYRRRSTAPDSHTHTYTDTHTHRCHPNEPNNYFANKLYLTSLWSIRMVGRQSRYPSWSIVRPAMTQCPCQSIDAVASLFGKTSSFQVHATYRNAIHTKISLQKKPQELIRFHRTHTAPSTVRPVRMTHGYGWVKCLFRSNRTFCLVYLWLRRQWVK